MNDFLEKFKPKEVKPVEPIITNAHPLKLNGPKYTAFLKRLKVRIKAKRAANKARNIQHQINKK